MLLLSGAAYAHNGVEPAPPPPPPPVPPVQAFDVDQLEGVLGPEGVERLLERRLEGTQPCAIRLTPVPVQPGTGFAIDQQAPDVLPPMSRVRPPAPPCTTALPGIYGTTRVGPGLVDEIRLLRDGSRLLRVGPDGGETPASPAEPVP